jgi:hypothetical protein
MMRQTERDFAFSMSAAEGRRAVGGGEGCQWDQRHSVFFLLFPSRLDNQGRTFGPEGVAACFHHGHLDNGSIIDAPSSSDLCVAFGPAAFSRKERSGETKARTDASPQLIGVASIGRTRRRILGVAR